MFNVIGWKFLVENTTAFHRDPIEMLRLLVWILNSNEDQIRALTFFFFLLLPLPRYEFTFSVIKR